MQTDVEITISKGKRSGSTETIHTTKVVVGNLDTDVPELRKMLGDKKVRQLLNSSLDLWARAKATLPQGKRSLRIAAALDWLENGNAPEKMKKYETINDIDSKAGDAFLEGVFESEHLALDD